MSCSLHAFIKIIIEFCKQYDIISSNDYLIFNLGNIKGQINAPNPHNPGRKLTKVEFPLDYQDGEEFKIYLFSSGQQHDILDKLPETTVIETTNLLKKLHDEAVSTKETVIIVSEKTEHFNNVEHVFRIEFYISDQEWKHMGAGDLIVNFH